jgi:hypothetical protein
MNEQIETKQETKSERFLPKVVDDVTIAFPANVEHLLPPGNWRDAPKPSAGACKLVGDWFFCGVTNLKFVPREGVDVTLALRHLRAILGSYSLKHEHKEWAVATLCDLWFSDWSYETAKK